MSAPVAIVGIGCRFPGGVTGPDGLWAALAGGRHVVGEVPRDRFDLSRWHDPRPATPGRVMTRWGGFLEGIEEFDAGFFGISPREAELLDPQQRLLLETAWEALEDAGQDAAALEGTRAGVFVGQWISDFEARLFAAPEEVDFYATLGSGRYAASGRISYALGLRGPSLTLDTACSSSLVAVHLAVRSLRAGECDLALAGGANVILQPHVTIAYSQSRMMAPDGRCKFGDASGDGYVRSEGAAVVALKPLDRALRDGDRIYAVVRGSAVNNDGRSSGSMGTPSRAGQEELLRAAYRDAAVAPGAVGYVEAHGTGTRTGDPVELAALGAVLGEARAPGDRALVGSLKTNLGHTEGAAGVAGLVKSALALHRGEVPASLHLRAPNPAVPWAELPLRIPTAAAPWPRGPRPRLAGVSAFGIAGTNAHVVLEEAPPAAPRTAAAPARATALLPLSARSPAALRALAGRYADLLERRDAPPLADVCAAAAHRRAHLEHRALFTGEGGAALAEALRAHAAGGPAAADGRAAPRPRVAFVLPGQGGQWRGMARELLAREPVFRRALEACDAEVRRLAGWSLLEVLQDGGDGPDEAFGRIEVVQPALVSLAIAYAALLREVGVTPDAVVGHSMGEVAAAHIAGALDLAQAMAVVCRRSALMARVRGRGAMALVELPADALRRRLDPAGGLEVAVVNGPRSAVVSGEPAAVEALLAALVDEGVFCRRVKVDVASHSRQMDPLAGELERALEGLTPSATGVPLWSTVLGRRAEGVELGAAYWAMNLRRPVLFGPVVEGLLADGIDLFVELGPHPVLVPALEQIAQGAGRRIRAVGCGRRDAPEQATFLAAAGALWAAGRPLDWTRLLPPGPPVDLPTYPWQRERHWAEAASPDRAFGSGAAAVARPPPEARAWLHHAVWRPAPAAGAAGPRSWLVAGEGDGAAAVAGALEARGASVVRTARAGLEAALRAGQPAGVDRGVAVVAPAGEDAAYEPVRALQATLAAGAAARLWFLTRGAQPAGPAGRLDVEQAALWGAARVLAEEHPDLWGGLVDLDPSSEVEARATAVAEHLRAGDGEDQVALRGGGRFALRLERAEAGEGHAPFPWRRDATYLVTGGLGGLGLRAAHALARAGARRLLLVGRTPLPQRERWASVDPESAAGRRIAAVRALEAEGAAVHVAALDVGDAAEVGAFLARWVAEGWPAIRGVVHAAATVENRLASAMDRPSFETVLRAKLRGAQVLDRLLPDLDLFLLFSSVAALLANPGHANYAAANAGLDALAHDRRARGQPALAIGWGIWADTGLARAENVTAHVVREGLRPFAPEIGEALLTALCGRREAHFAVMPVDWAVFRRARAGRGARLYGELAEGGVTVHGGGVARQLEEASPQERRRLLSACVREAVGTVLKIPPARLDGQRTFGALGMSSLLAMELRNRLEATLDRSLPATLAFNYPTLDALIEHLAGEPAGPPVPCAPAAQPEAISDVARLSDDEALRALRGMGGKP